MDAEILEEDLMEMYADAQSQHDNGGLENGVIDINSDGSDDNECEQALIESELFDINKQIEILMDKKDTLMARKNALEEQNVENKRKRVCLLKQAKLVDPNQEETLTKAALKYFNISKFRPLQMDTMLTTMKGEDCILIMPTGGGKSLTFQLPAVVKGGVTVVVSPLLSLMEDQVTGLRRHGVNVFMITGTTPASEQADILKQMADPSSSLKLLYVTPEKMSKAKRFQTAMEKCYAADNLTRIVVDEVHCVSAWGHDFRPDYKILATLKRQYPGTPILGLTATATSKVLADVQRCLRIPQCKVLRASFNRPNLHYEVIPKATGGVTAVCEQIATMIKGRFAGQSGLIYCYSRNDCESVMGGLSKYNLRVAYYHASLNINERSRVHQDWLNNRIQCIVATVAFGMGIDKPDVRWIVHHNMSKSIENYYQESGRAGRDGAVSKCVLLYQPSDYFKISTMVASEASGLSHAYDMLGYCIAGKCRRVTLAEFFGEAFSASDCNKTCDRCTKAAYVSQDVTQLAVKLIGMIEVHAGKDKDLTFNMLVKEWSGGKLSGAMKENVVCSLIHQNVLTEKFKAGMYKLLSYVIPGPKARAVKVGNLKVSMDVSQGASAMFKTPPATVTTTSLYAPAPVPTHSVLTQPSTKGTKGTKPSKKRKAMQFDSDSD